MSRKVINVVSTSKSNDIVLNFNLTVEEYEALSASGLTLTNEEFFARVGYDCNSLLQAFEENSFVKVYVKGMVSAEGVTLNCFSPMSYTYENEQIFMYSLPIFDNSILDVELSPSEVKVKFQ